MEYDNDMEYIGLSPEMIAARESAKKLAAERAAKRESERRQELIEKGEHDPLSELSDEEIAELAKANQRRYYRENKERIKANKMRCLARKELERGE